MSRRRTITGLAALALLVAACGTEGEGGTDTSQATEPAASEPAAAEGELEVAPGTMIDTADCPTDWENAGGVTEDEIRLFISLPESGPVATLGEIDDGMQAYFDHVNETEPVAGREIVLESADDAYDPARTLTNVEEALSTDAPFAFVNIIGSPPNLAVRDVLNDECVPQLFNQTGLPDWGDPTAYPWTTGGLLSYNTEARIWCEHIVDEFGEGASVAGLFMNNEFGASYRDEVEACAEEGLIDLVEVVNHDPTAPDVTGDITTLAASEADAVVLGTTGAACSQSMAALAGSSWDPMAFLHGGCQSISTYFEPIDPAGEGVIVAVTAKNPSDPQFADDEAVQEAIEVVEGAGLDPYSGAAWSGYTIAQPVVSLLRSVAEMEGGLTRVNLMRGAWNAELDSTLDLEGATLQTAGVDDAYLIESARLAAYRPPEGDAQTGSFENVTDIINLEGETGSVQE